MIKITNQSFLEYSQIFINAHTGAIIAYIDTKKGAMNRVIYKAYKYEGGNSIYLKMKDYNDFTLRYRDNPYYCSIYPCHLYGDAADLYDNLKVMYDYWYDNFEWDSYDGEGSPMKAVYDYLLCEKNDFENPNDDCHVYCNPPGYPNECSLMSSEPQEGYWNGYYWEGSGNDFIYIYGHATDSGMYYKNFNRYPTDVTQPTEDIASFNSDNVSLDFVAHEFGHGFNAATSKLRYHVQPGAIDEHLCDCLAAHVDDDNWTLYENTAWATYYGGVRSLKNPSDSKTNNWLSLHST